MGDARLPLRLDTTCLPLSTRLGITVSACSRWAGNRIGSECRCATWQPMLGASSLRCYWLLTLVSCVR